jgi:hypothetical protein
MQILINHVNQTPSLAGFDTVRVEGQLSDPVSKAYFQLDDTGSQIALAVSQEVIIVDETIQLTRITGSTTTGISAAWSDTFATNTSSSYTSTDATGGSVATWTYGTNTLTPSGGTKALYLLNSWTGASIDINATMTQSDQAGLAWRWQDASNFYELAVRDATAGTVAYTDSFATNTSSSYTSTFNPSPPGSASTWTYGTNTLTATNGLYALYLLNSWTATNVDLTITMTSSAFGGIAWRVQDTQNFYEIAVRDASSSTGANTFAFFKTVAGTRTAIGTTPAITFTRGTSHTIRITMSSTTITAYFDGVSKASFTDSSLAGPGQVGLRNDAFGGQSTAIFTSISFTDTDTYANTMQLYKTVAGTRSTIGASTAIAFTRGTSHVVRVTMASTAITVYFDGASTITATDSAFSAAGQVGLRSDTVNLKSSGIFTAFNATDNDPGVTTYSSTVDTAIPTHNYLNNNNFNFGAGTGSGGWTETGALTGRITFPPSVTVGPLAVATLTFSNQAVGSDARYQNAPSYYAIAGQKYCLSATMNVTTLFTNSYAFLQILFLDVSGSTLGTFTSAHITAAGASRSFVTGTAPANTATIQAVFGGTTTNTTNSGVATFTALQLEPMWFTATPAPNVTAGYVAQYPTPICDFLQPDSCTVIDGTAVRFDRAFAGFVDNAKSTYNGPNRIWDGECTSLAGYLETDVLINRTYTGTSDAQIIHNHLHSTTHLIAKQPPDISVNGPDYANANIVVALPGQVIDSTVYNDATPREMLNDLQGYSGYIFGVDNYNNVFYTPQLYNKAPYGFSLSPDNVTTFSMYDYELKIDGSQIRNCIHVSGGTYQPTFTDTVVSGDGTHSQNYSGGVMINFDTTYQGVTIPAVVANGSTLVVGGPGALYSQGYTAIYTDTVNLVALLNGVPTGQTVTATYKYDALVYVEVQDIGSIQQYGQRWYKINDSALVTLAAAQARGEAELAQYAQPLQILSFKTQKMLSPGQVIQVTNSYDGLSTAKFVVQKCTVTWLGNNYNEYAVECGAYQPDLIDYVRNIHKAITRGKSNATAIIQSFVTANEGDNITFTDSVNIH